MSTLAELLVVEVEHINHATGVAAAAELRRLSQVEAEHAALLKAISDAIPVFWYRPVMNGDMYEGPHHNNCFAGRLQRAEKPGEWLPLYTLNGIKKP